VHLDSGGLTLARALRHLPCSVDRVDVFERQPIVGPNIGGGVQINGGAAILARLGLNAELDKSRVRVNRVLTRAVSGRVLLDVDVLKAAAARLSPSSDSPGIEVSVKCHKRKAHIFCC
jgi:hypothetical protein